MSVDANVAKHFALHSNNFVYTFQLISLASVDAILFAHLCGFVCLFIWLFDTFTSILE